MDAKNDACRTCRHFDIPWGCPAFQKGVPADITSGENRHLEKHPNQIGDFVYSPKEESGNK